MAKIKLWQAGQEKAELSKRLQNARQARQPYENQWRTNEQAIYSPTGSFDANLGESIMTAVESNSYSGSSPSDNISVNYIMKDVRYIHSQLSLNPPSVLPRPQTSDFDDRRKADAADRLVKFGIRQYKMLEEFDQTTLNCLIYGSAFLKGVYDPMLGEIADFDAATGEINMEGDYELATKSCWFIYPDPEASKWTDVTYVFEEFFMRYEEACFRFPDRIDILEKYRHKEQDDGNGGGGQSSTLKNKKFDTIRIYQYWEKGTPYNGMVGRFCWCTGDGDLLCKLSANPHAFAKPKSDGSKGVPVAKLPYHILTDLDVPNTYWGQSMVSYAASMQDAVNKMDNVTLDIMKAHGVVRLILPDTAEISDESITNSPYDIIKFSGQREPQFMPAMPFPEAMNAFREKMRLGIDDSMGVNESMFGQQSREQSGFSMQYATQQGNIIRRRLFNKYVSLVEQVWKDFFSIVVQEWSESRTISVLGKEKAFESMDIAGTDVDGGFDLVVEYGASLSLDPTTRREEIITLIPLFKEAGMDVRSLLKLMKLNDLSSMYDALEMAADRQREIFDEMGANNLFIKPSALEDHKNMLDFASSYRMSSEFKYLPDGHKALIEAHIEARKEMAAASAAGQAPAGAPPEGAPPSAEGGTPVPFQPPEAPLAGLF